MYNTDKSTYFHRVQQLKSFVSLSTALFHSLLWLFFVLALLISAFQALHTPLYDWILNATVHVSETINICIHNCILYYIIPMILTLNKLLVLPDVFIFSLQISQNVLSPSL